MRAAVQRAHVDHGLAYRDSVAAPMAGREIVVLAPPIKVLMVLLLHMSRCVGDGASSAGRHASRPPWRARPAVPAGRRAPLPSSGCGKPPPEQPHLAPLCALALAAVNCTGARTLNYRACERCAVRHEVELALAGCDRLMTGVFCYKLNTVQDPRFQQVSASTSALGATVSSPHMCRAHHSSTGLSDSAMHTGCDSETDAVHAAACRSTCPTRRSRARTSGPTCCTSRTATTRPSRTRSFWTTTATTSRRC